LDYIDGVFFKKEEFLIRALEDGGFPPDDGPVAALRSEQQKSRTAADLLLENSQKWQSGDDSDRIAVGWATSEYTTVLRAHLERLKNLIYPLLEQTITEDEEQHIIEAIQQASPNGGSENYVRLLESLEEELSDWK
jgi:hemerythrin-like domain-containing protein